MSHSDIGPNEQRLRELREERMRRAQTRVAPRPTPPSKIKRAKKGKKR